MKKIFAILISLLFVASVFGVASILGEACRPTDVSSSTVRVGETFTFSFKSEGTPDITDINLTGTGAVVLVSGPTKVDEYTWIITYRAISPGDVKINAGSPNCESRVQIISRDLPFKFFAKLFKFGQKK
ncbi:MAG TPA: hypothetical protein PLA04_07075 [Methanofastidiosum sp.]|uniref:Uncharacterized protein n=1 Tax=Candidatus Methanofastidiosum methylothiophilum TaxID=1705564 RepID=A0A150JEL2_9EURY|nr:MAG: hypothetical protein APG09_01581 [Candidatus Methanofastidiosum methylthiophilus]HPU91938.1 hypothetical protein [Methanofastidiosum sp.]